MAEARTVLFIDLDATIMTNPFWTAVFPIISKALSGKTGRSTETIIKDLVVENRYRLENPPCDRALAMDWDDIASTVADVYGVPFLLSVEDLVRAHSSPPYTSSLDSAGLVLKSLSQKPTRKLVAASMGLSKYQFPVLRSLELFDLFEDFLMPDLTGYLKTDREFYGKYLHQIGSSVLISVGDHYIDDIIYPKSFGFHAILKAVVPQLTPLMPFERPNHVMKHRDKVRSLPVETSVLPDAVITHLTELPGVVEQIERAECQEI